MRSKVWVLGISKRAATMCATQSLLYEKHIELLTVADMDIARAAINALHIQGVILCKHSWSVDERDQLVLELAEVRPSLAFILRCPGCEQSDEAAAVVGYLPDPMVVNDLVAAMAIEPEAA